MSGTRTRSAAQLRSVVVSVAEEVFAAVEVVRQETVDLHHAVGQRGEPIRGGDVSDLRHGIQAQLRRGAGLVIGLGLIVAPDLLADQPLRLEWWQREPGEEQPTALQVDLNRLSPGFYDYEAAEWFDLPRRTGRRHVVGPYVDVHGTGRYLLTFTAPVESDGQFLGVAGADVPVAWLETRLLRELGTDREVVILNPDGRVVLSTSPRWLAGDLLEPEADPRLLCRPLPALPWRVGVISPNR